METVENRQNIQNQEIPEPSLMESALATARVYSFVHDAVSTGDNQRKEQERTTLKKEQFLKIFSVSMGTITVACEKADIHRETYYLWMKTDPAFRSAVNEIERQRVDMTEDRLFKLIQQDDGPSIRFFLERKASEYKAKSQTEIVTGDKTFEDILYEQAERRRALAETGKEPVKEKDHGTDPQ